MDLDILKEKWAEQDRKIDSCVRLNRRLLMAVNIIGGTGTSRRFCSCDWTVVSLVS
jgi:hypothetical protein